MLTPTESTQAWFTTWECHCSETDTVSVPERCPGHDRAVILPAEQITAIYLGHECDDLNPCPEETTTPNPTTQDSQ